MRILPLVLLLTGCASVEMAPPAQPPDRDLSGPPPSYRKLISAQLIQIVGSANAAGPLQISPLRRVDSFKGPAWLVCLRSVGRAQPLEHAIFIQNEKIVDSRVAVRTDRCEEQPSEAFGVFSNSRNAAR